MKPNIAKIFFNVAYFRRQKYLLISRFIKDPAKRIILSLFLSLTTGVVFGQVDYVTVNRIEVSGNKKTKTHILLRELNVHTGDTIHVHNLSSRIAFNQTLLMNTGLFNSAKFNVKNWDTETAVIDLAIEVQEFWFIYPFPILELSDRNFNEWWQTYNASLSRVNIGLRFYHINLTGRRDQLKLVTQFGFTRKYEIAYNLPAVNREQTIGVFANALYTQNKELAYGVLNDTFQFFRNENVELLQRIRGGIGVNYRPGLFATTGVALNFHQYTIDETVATELNPRFFTSGLRQRFFSIRFHFNWDRRDKRPYALNGFQILAALEKSGLGIFNDLNIGNFQLTVKKYHSFSRRWSTELIGKVKAGIVRDDQPFYNYIGLGFENDFVRGYELYVINGLDYAYAKTRLRFEIFNYQFNWGRIMPIRAFRQMPVRWYLTFNNDVGYVNDPFFNANNTLRNELLWGGGVGLDIVVFYDKVFQVEYSVNRLGESGIFLHWELNF